MCLVPPKSQTDGQEVLCALDSSTYDDLVLGHLIEETKFQASSNFESFECVHVSRFCNEAAHELAYLGYLCTGGEGIITDFVPEDITVIVATIQLANEL